MAKTQYVALLRGINVGGGNIIKGMQPRKRCHVYSKRNVVFETQPDGAKLVRKLEQALSRTFSPDVLTPSFDESSERHRKVSGAGRNSIATT
jgi:uncharacterized protein (DUF1697 family)